MDLRAIVMGLAFAFMWSSAFTSARIIVAVAPPMSALALRFLVSGVLAVLIAAALGQSWRLTKDQWRATIIFGICQNALYLGLYFIAMRTLEAGFASIIASTMPLMVAFAGWAVYRQRLPRQAWVGLAAGVAGVVLIMGARISGGADLVGVLLCFIGTLALTLATLSVSGASSGGNVLMIVGLQMLVGSAVLAVPAALLEDHHIQLSSELVLAFLYTTLFPGLAATFVWFLLVNRIGPIRAATFHFLNPVFGVAIAAVVLGEPMTWLDAVGVGIIMVGILAVQLSKQSAARTG